MNYIRKNIQVCKTYKIVVILISLIYIVGIFVGMLLPTYKEKLFFTKNMIKLFSDAFYYRGNAFSIFLSMFLSDFFCLILIFLGSSKIAFFPMNYLLMFYRGYVIGASGITLIISFGITGIVLFFFVVFLENLCATVGMIVLSVLLFDYKKNNNNLKHNFFKQNLPIFLSIIIFVLLIIMLSVCILFLFLKPINFC